MPVEFLFLYDNFSTAYDVQKKLENLRTYFGKDYGKELGVQTTLGLGRRESFSLIVAVLQVTHVFKRSDKIR